MEEADRICTSFGASLVPLAAGGPAITRDLSSADDAEEAVHSVALAIDAVLAAALRPHLR